MDNLHLDRRMVRTRAAIVQAFKELIIEKEYDDITVTELAERANINRKTFYSHYRCLEDILDDLQLETAERLVEIYKKHNVGGFDIKAFTATLNEILNENYLFYRRLVMANSYRFFSRNIKDLLKTAFISQYLRTEKVGKEVMNLVAEYTVSGIVKMYRVWFEDPSGISAERLAELAGVMVWNGMSAVLEGK